jgi:monomeric sarcosine oxidase
LESYDVIVIGGGTMGTAVGWALGKRRLRTLVLEQFQPIHSLGSHGGRTRITRHAYAESPDYVPLVERSEEIWLELAAEAGTPLLIRTGGLDLQAPGYTHARGAARAAIERNLPHEWLPGAQVRGRWPAWSIGDDWEACFSPQTGFLLVEPCLHAMAAAARRLGVTYHQLEAAREWHADSGGVTVRTDSQRYYANSLVITAGAWASQVLGELGLPLTVLRKVIWWFAVRDPSRFGVSQFPIFIAEGPLGVIYGLPIYGHQGIKIANHAGGESTSPDAVDRVVHLAEEADVVAFTGSALPAVSDHVLESAVCLYTLTPDRDFIVDRHPVHPNVAIAAGFSGHGFKFAPVIGELLASLVLDPSSRAIPRFAVSRLLA